MQKRGPFWGPASGRPSAEGRRPSAGFLQPAKGRPLRGRRGRWETMKMTMVGVGGRRMPSANGMRISCARSGTRWSGLSAVSNGTPIFAQLFAKSAGFCLPAGTRMRHPAAFACSDAAIFVSVRLSAPELCPGFLNEGGASFSAPG